MSVLDQAVIKAYSKKAGAARPTSPSSSPKAHVPMPTHPPHQPSADSVYDDGALYRNDAGDWTASANPSAHRSAIAARPRRPAEAEQPSPHPAVPTVPKENAPRSAEESQPSISLLDYSEAYVVSSGAAASEASIIRCDPPQLTAAPPSHLRFEPATVESPKVDAHPPVSAGAPSDVIIDTAAESVAVKTEIAPQQPESQNHLGVEAPSGAGPNLDEPQLETVESVEPASPPLVPAWEVDRFIWPNVAEDLLAHRASEIDLIGQRLIAAAQQGQKIIAISSYTRGEGRTSLALCLARWACAAGLRIALVDGDLQKPQLATRLGMNPPAGWESVITHGESVSEAAVASLEDGLTLLPVQTPQTSQDLVLSQAAQGVLRQFSAEFDLVLVDTEPIIADENTATARPKSRPRPFDAAVLVQDVRRSTADNVDQALLHLEQFQLPVLAVVENFTRGEIQP